MIYGEEIYKNIDYQEQQNKIEREKKNQMTTRFVTLSKLALANLAELLIITLDKPTCDLMGNRSSSIIILI